MANGDGVRQLQQLHQVMADYPQLPTLSDKFRASRGGDLPDWPDWCFLPMAAAHAIISGGTQLPLHLVPDIARVSALNAWRYTRGIYRFHPQLADALTKSSIDGDLPIDVFLRLPEWGLYVEMPALTDGIAWHDPARLLRPPRVRHQHRPARAAAAAR